MVFSLTFKKSKHLQENIYQPRLSPTDSGFLRRQGAGGVIPIGYNYIPESKWQHRLVKTHKKHKQKFHHSQLTKKIGSVLLIFWSAYTLVISLELKDSCVWYPYYYFAYVGHCIFERCLNSNPDSCRSKQARYQLSHPSPYLLRHYFSTFTAMLSFRRPSFDHYARFLSILVLWVSS